jgi:hypothetical protein
MSEPGEKAREIVERIRSECYDGYDNNDTYEGSTFDDKKAVVIIQAALDEAAEYHQQGGGKC